MSLGEGVKRKKGAMFDAAAAAADYHLPQLQQKRSRETPKPEGFAAFFSFFSLTHQKNREKSWSPLEYLDPPPLL